MDAADLEDRDIGAPLALVVGEDREQAGQQGPSQLRVIVSDRVGDADGRWVVAREAQAFVVGRPDQAVRHDLREALAREQVASSIDRPSRVRPIRGRPCRGQRRRDRLVASDAGDLLDDIGLDAKIPTMPGDDRHQGL